MEEFVVDSGFIKKAYKKLKSSVYFDKTQLVLRDAIVEFECSVDDLDSELDKLWGEFQDDAEWDKCKESILSSISVLSFPKKLKPDKKSIIMNSVSDEVKVEELQHFVNMDVRGHIIGVLWLLLIGWHIDKEIYEHSYGNRIRKKLINEFSNKATYSPYLFEPYFEQYESWRDTALTHAGKCLNRKQDVVILTLDFRRYYYSVHMDKQAFDDFITHVDMDDMDESVKYTFKKVNDFVLSVIETYAKKFGQEYDDRNILPIGFLPSNVLANWCLSKFDNAVVDGWNPVYYGRYVDDILIVDKIETNSEIYKKAKNQELTRDDVIKHFLAQCSKWSKSPSGNEDKSNFALLKVDEDLTAKEKDESIQVYVVNKLYNAAKDSKIIVHNDKVKIFYFKNGETDALLNCFQNDISKNKSEFRYMPEDEAVFQNDDYSEIYNLEKSDSLNKLRGVDGISIDRFALSKYLGKYLRIGSLINDKLESGFEKDIAKIFNSKTIIENHTAWEKVIEIFVINNRFNALNDFINKIIKSVRGISYLNDVSKFTTEQIQESLLLFLRSALCRAISLNWGASSRASIKKTCDYLMDKFSDVKIYKFDPTEMLQLRRNYCKTRMNDKYVIPMLIDVLLENGVVVYSLDDNSEINLTDFRQIISIKIANDVASLNYKYYPYMITMHDLSIYSTVTSMYHHNCCNDVLEVNRKEIIEKEKKAYLRCNYASDNVEEKSQISKLVMIKENGKLPNAVAVKVGNETKDSIKVAVANVKVSNNNFDMVVKDSPNRGYRRYKDLSVLVNQSIKEKADMLIMPESFVPFEWLATVARTCAKNQLAIMTGVEHVKMKNNMFNLTAIILPYKEGDTKSAYISFHLKKHYSHREIQEINGYRLKPIVGNAYELYYWNDCWFPVYCCFELSSIKDRALFQSYADVLIAVEWNPDTHYYSNIMESLSRDLHCYCIQVNSSNYGDSRITKPSKTEEKDIIRTKGGINSTILVDRINIKSLREYQFKEYELQREVNEFKPTPPDFNRDIVELKMKHRLWDEFDDI